jgi:hypothetical protein
MFLIKNKKNAIRRRSNPCKYFGFMSKQTPSVGNRESVGHKRRDKGAAARQNARRARPRLFLNATPKFLKAPFQ